MKKCLFEKGKKVLRFRLFIGPWLLITTCNKEKEYGLNECKNKNMNKRKFHFLMTRLQILKELECTNPDASMEPIGLHAHAKTWENRENQSKES